MYILFFGAIVARWAVRNGQDVISFFLSVSSDTETKRRMFFAAFFTVKIANLACA